VVIGLLPVYCSVTTPCILPDSDNIVHVSAKKLKKADFVLVSVQQIQKNP
jgi:hypothetical protein